MAGAAACRAPIGQRSRSMRRGPWRSPCSASGLGLTVLAACSGPRRRPTSRPAAPPRVFESAAGRPRCAIATARKLGSPSPPACTAPLPAAVYVHGGSWVSGDYNTGGFIINGIGPALVAQGFVVVSLNYRLGPRAHWPDQIVDVKCAIRYLRANAHRFDIDPDRDRGLGTERRRAPGGAARHRGPECRLGHGRLSLRVERRAGGGGHGGAERPADPGQPGRGGPRRRDLHPPARERAAQAGRRRPEAGQPDDLCRGGRPALPHPLLEQRRRSSPRSSPWSSPGTSEWPACPISWSWCSTAGTPSTRRARSPPRRRSSTRWSASSSASSCSTRPRPGDRA